MRRENWCTFHHASRNLSFSVRDLVLGAGASRGKGPFAEGGALTNANYAHAFPRRDPLGATTWTRQTAGLRALKISSSFVQRDLDTACSIFSDYSTS